MSTFTIEYQHTYPDPNCNCEMCLEAKWDDMFIPTEEEAYAIHCATDGSFHLADL